MFELKAQMYFAAAHHLLNYEGECECIAGQSRGPGKDGG